MITPNTKDFDLDAPVVVRVIRAPPLQPQHGIRDGREFVSKRCQRFMTLRSGEPAAPYQQNLRGHWVDGDAGEPVLLLGREYEVLGPSTIEPGDGAVP